MATLKYFDGSQWIDIGGGGSGTSDYSALTNKPQINSITLSGNKTAAQLSLASASHTHTEAEVTNLTTDLAAKVSEPSADGTAGQVLATNGSGGRYWKTVSGGGGGGMELIWTNPNPTSSMAANTTISLDLSGYTAVAIHAVYNSGSATLIYGDMSIIPVGGSGRIAVHAFTQISSNDRWVIATRTAATSSTGVTFGAGARWSYNNSTSGAAFAVPEYIYGIK